ncbi:MAG: anti-sigma factor, partial [Flavobacterium sp.]|nr:anti-sigma factor [Flavobacterium sp.]
MENKEYISSGILELYVYGLLTEAENIKVSKMAKANTDIDAEIVSIEKAIINLSTSFSPFLSVENFAKIKSKLEIKHARIIELNENKSSKFQYLGWAAAAIFFLGAGYLYNNKSLIENHVVNLETDRSKLKEVLVLTEKKSNKNQEDLAIIQNSKNKLVSLGGQSVSPTSYA